MQVEVVVHSIEVRAWSAIEIGSFEGIIGEVVGDVEEDGFLCCVRLLFSWLFEGIVVIAVAVDIVRVDLFEILLETNSKESASSTIRISLA